MKYVDRATFQGINSLHKSFVYILVGSMIVVGCSAAHVAMVIDHQGKKIDINDANTCLNCHDDMKGHSHPVMVPYPPAGKEKEYTSVSAVKKSGVKLLDGKVTCITCHDLENPQSSHPIKNMSKSELCLVCHLK